MKYLNKLGAVSLAAATYTTLALPAFAQTQVDPCPQGTANFNKLCSSFGVDSFGRIIGTAISAIFVIAVLIALFYLIWGGIKWILSGGDKGKVEAARGSIIAAIIGLIITFLAYFILNLVLQIFGLGSVSTLTLPQF